MTMLKQITTGQTVTITAAELESLTYAWEDRGDPPVPTFIEIRRYRLVRADGETHEVKSVGVECDPQDVMDMTSRWGLAQDAIIKAEAAS